MNKGIVMNAWFDVPPMGPEMFSKVDQKGFVSSMAYVFSIIKDEVASGTPMQRIIIGGFSQGGCLGIHTVLKCPYHTSIEFNPRMKDCCSAWLRSPWYSDQKSTKTAKSAWQGM